MPAPTLHLVELRTNRHQQMLVDVGIVLKKAYGDDYADTFLKSMNVPHAVVARVLSGVGLRPLQHSALPVVP